MIFTDRKITIRNGKSSINEPVILYRGDFEVSIRFTIMESKFRFKSGVNLVDSEKASYGQLAILAPYGGNVFSETVKCEDGTVTFTLTKEMIDQLEEVGLYSFQIRLFDYYRESRVSIPPVEFGIEVREPVASEDHDNSVNNAIVGYSIAKVADALNEDVPDTFDANGNYNKTDWETGDRITEGKLNKIEDAIDILNENDNVLDKRIVNNYNVLTSELNNKMDKTTKDISVSQINKNLGKLDQSYMSEEFLLQISGDTPIQSTPMREGVTRDKIADNSITSDLISFIKKSNNLFNKDKLTKGYTISGTTGELTANESFYVSDFIYLKPNQTYTCNLIARWALYDDNFKFISSKTASTFTTTDNVYYGRFVSSKYNYNIAQVNAGVLVDFDEYEMRLERGDNGLSIIPTPRSISEEALNENVITPYSSVFFKKSNNLFNPNTVTFGEKIDSNGNIIEDATRVLSDFIIVDGNQAYSKPAVACEVSFYNINNDFMSRRELPVNTQTFTTPLSCYNIRISVKTSAYTGFWINKGEELLPFDEFVYELQSTAQFPIKINESLFPELPEDPTPTTEFRLRPLRYFEFTKLSYEDLIQHINSSIYNECTVEDLGVSCDGVNHIYGMSFGDTSNKPTVLLFNQHSSEWVAVYYALEFLRILNSDKDFSDQNFIDSLKENLSFYFIVAANPYGYINASYVNYNGVNLNRNWDHNWEDYDSKGTAANNKGSSPFSEVDIQIVRDKILELQPHMVIDCHTNGQSPGGMDTNRSDGTYYDLLTECYARINEVFDDSSLETQVWNLGGSPTSVGWIGRQYNKDGDKIIATVVEQPLPHIANYGTTSILYLCYYLMRHLNILD